MLKIGHPMEDENGFNGGLRDRIFKKGLNAKLLSKELNKFSSITQKLVHLKELCNSNKGQEGFVDTIFTMVEKTAKEHFLDTRNVEFTFWFLKYNAGRLFERWTKGKEWQRKLHSNLAKSHTRFELDRILKKETDCLGKLDKYSAAYKKGKGHMYIFNSSIPDIESIRVLDGNYYSTYPTEHEYTVVESPEVKAYFEHILLKPYLEKLLADFQTIEEVNTKGKASKVNIKPIADAEEVQNLKIISTYIFEDKIADFKKKLERFKKYQKENGKTKKDKIYFLHYIVEDGFLLSHIQGKKIKPLHRKRFIEDLFGMEKGSLKHVYKAHFNKIRVNHLTTLLKQS
jgi:hypothetical protein